MSEIEGLRKQVEEKEEALAAFKLKTKKYIESKTKQHEEAVTELKRQHAEELEKLKGHASSAAPDDAGSLAAISLCSVQR